MPKAQGTTFQHVRRLLAAALVVSNRLFFWSRVFARAQRNTMCCIICVKENQTHTHTRTMLTNLWSTFQQHPWTFDVTLKWSMLNWIHLLVTLGIACLPNKCWLSSQAVMKKTPAYGAWSWRACKRKQKQQDMEPTMKWSLVPIVIY